MPDAAIAIAPPLNHNSCFAILRRRIGAEYDGDVSAAGKIAVEEAFGRPTIVRG